MYNLFVSGVTYLNSLWQAHRNGWNIVGSLVDALLDVQCCTSVMEALAGELLEGTCRVLTGSNHTRDGCYTRRIRSGVGEDYPAPWGT